MRLGTGEKIVAIHREHVAVGRRAIGSGVGLTGLLVLEHIQKYYLSGLTKPILTS
jgi:hypothetical protein